MNKNIATTPSLSFKEALCKAWSNLTNLKGRSRRSEFWWFMLVFYIALQIVSGILSLFLPELASTVVQSILMGFAFAVTVRRLQDGGHSMLWVAISWVANLALNVSLFASDEWTTFQATANPEDLIAVLTLPQVASWAPSQPSQALSPLSSAAWMAPQALTSMANRQNMP